MNESLHCVSCNQTSWGLSPAPRHLQLQFFVSYHSSCHNNIVAGNWCSFF
uniref:Uncharacterized protein n=1 Tax=Rhizophora mucronata TaxID=61149 RepID=A0A2P2QK43_RHIMU